MSMYRICEAGLTDPGSKLLLLHLSYDVWVTVTLSGGTVCSGPTSGRGALGLGIAQSPPGEIRVHSCAINICNTSSPISLRGARRSLPSASPAVFLGGVKTRWQTRPVFCICCVQPLSVQQGHAGEGATSEDDISGRKPGSQSPGP